MKTVPVIRVMNPTPGQFATSDFETKYIKRLERSERMSIHDEWLETSEPTRIGWPCTTSRRPVSHRQARDQNRATPK